MTLPVKLRCGVAPSWLAAAVRPLTAAGWTPLEIAWHLVTRGGEYATLPDSIANPRGFIRDSLRNANPQIRPAIKWAADDAERDCQALAARMAEQIALATLLREDQHREQKLACGRAQREARERCDLCDEHGWLPVPDPAVGAVRCSHDPDTGGW